MADIWLQRFFVNTANKNTCQCKHRTARYNERNGACSREERGLEFTQAPWQELRCWMLPVHHVQEIRARMDQTHTLLEDSPQLHTHSPCCSSRK